MVVEAYRAVRRGESHIFWIFGLQTAVELTLCVRCAFFSRTIPGTHFC
jgi:hypothetical protein